MKDSISRPALVVAVMALTCLAGEPVAIPSYTFDGGGAMHSISADNRFLLSGTIGQHDAGAMTGGDFKLTGGFWFETPPGDCNENGIRDLADHVEFVDCLSGPDEAVDAACHCFDTSGEGHIDLRDFAESQRAFVGN